MHPSQFALTLIIPTPGCAASHGGAGFDTRMIRPKRFKLRNVKARKGNTDVFIQDAPKRLNTMHYISMFP